MSDDLDAARARSRAIRYATQEKSPHWLLAIAGGSGMWFACWVMMALAYFLVDFLRSQPWWMMLWAGTLTWFVFVLMQAFDKDAIRNEEVELE